MYTQMTTRCCFHPVTWDGWNHIYPSLTVDSHIFSSILQLQGVVFAAEQGRMLQNYSVLERDA